MPNITRGGRMQGLVAYLAGPGRAGGNEHSDPHLVAGDATIMYSHGGQQLDAFAAQEIADALDQPRVVFGTQVTVPDRRGAQLMLEPAQLPRRAAHVWHCSLSLHADEGVMSDETWGQIAERFVAKMGFVDAADEAPCRWMALRHGVSKINGNDHVHVVVSLVREDGTQVKAWNDRPNAQRACGELEREFGLQVLESRDVGRGARHSVPAERATASARRPSAEAPRRDEHARSDGPQARDVLTDRERLERTVRACSAAACDEAEFVRRVVGAGVRIRPRYATGRTDVVEGYSVAMRTARDVPASWYGGGRLARDLTLPRLRADWPDTPQSASAAVAEWNAAGDHQRPARPGREAQPVDPATWRECATDVARLRHQLQGVPLDDRATWARVAHDAAGAFAAWSLQVEGSPGPLADTARVLARSASLRAYETASPRRPLVSTRSVAALLSSAGRGGLGPVAEAALMLQLANTARALRDAHRAAGEAQRASELNKAMRAQLALSGAAPPAAPAPAPPDLGLGQQPGPVQPWPPTRSDRDLGR